MTLIFVESKHIDIAENIAVGGNKCGRRGKRIDKTWYLPLMVLSST